MKLADLAREPLEQVEDARVQHFPSAELLGHHQVACGVEVHPGTRSAEGDEKGTVAGSRGQGVGALYPARTPATSERGANPDVSESR